MAVNLDDMNGERTNGGRLERYIVKPSAGLGHIGWPTGFSGCGWAVLDTDGSVVSRHAFRIEALNALIRHDGLTGVTADSLAGDLRSTTEEAR